MKTIVLDVSVLNEKNKTGVGVYTYQLIKHLLDLNKKDRFILFGISTLDTYNYLKNIEFKKCPNVEMKIYKVPSKFFRKAFLLWQKFDWPKMEKFVGEFDILHSFNWNLPPIRSGKIIATVFDMTPILFPNFHQKKTIQLDRIRLERIKKKAGLVITISENSKKDFLRFSPKSLVKVIYPGVSSHFKVKITSGKVKEVLEKYTLTKGYILSVGTLEPRKNLEGLIRAFAHLTPQGDALRAYTLVIAGANGWLSDEIYRLPKKLGIEENVKFIGRVEDEDLPYLYNQALCLVYPSFYEGFGMPVLEAQACGCPVITSSISSLPEAAGEGAILVDPISTEDIIRGIREIGEIGDKLIEKGFENAKRFSWEKSAKNLNLLYQSI